MKFVIKEKQNLASLVPGMNLRDYFAGQVLAEQYKNSVLIFGEGGFARDAKEDVIYSHAAEIAYLVANEMLKQKAKYDSEQSS